MAKNISELTEQLSNCPFCGSEEIEIVEVQEPLDELNSFYRAECGICYAKSDSFSYAHQVVLAWNRRA